MKLILFLILFFANTSNLFAQDSEQTPKDAYMMAVCEGLIMQASDPLLKKILLADQWQIDYLVLQMKKSNHIDVDIYIKTTARSTDREAAPILKYNCFKCPRAIDQIVLSQDNDIELACAN